MFQFLVKEKQSPPKGTRYSTGDIVLLHQNQQFACAVIKYIGQTPLFPNATTVGVEVFFDENKTFYKINNIQIQNSTIHGFNDNKPLFTTSRSGTPKFITNDEIDTLIWDDKMEQQALKCKTFSKDAFIIGCKVGNLELIKHCMEHTKGYTTPILYSQYQLNEFAKHSSHGNQRRMMRKSPFHQRHPHRWFCAFEDAVFHNHDHIVKYIVDYHKKSNHPNDYALWKQTHVFYDLVPFRNYGWSTSVMTAPNECKQPPNDELFHIPQMFVSLCARQNYDMLEYFFREANWKMWHSLDYTAFESGLRKGDVELIKLLVKYNQHLFLNHSFLVMKSLTLSVPGHIDILRFFLNEIVPNATFDAVKLYSCLGEHYHKDKNSTKYDYFAPLILKSIMSYPGAFNEDVLNVLLQYEEGWNVNFRPNCTFKYQTDKLRVACMENANKYNNGFLLRYDSTLTVASVFAAFIYQYQDPYSYSTSAFQAIIRSLIRAGLDIDDDENYYWFEYKSVQSKRNALKKSGVRSKKPYQKGWIYHDMLDLNVEFRKLLKVTLKAEIESIRNDIIGAVKDIFVDEMILGVFQDYILNWVCADPTSLWKLKWFASV
eukprot:185041_1